MPVNATLHVGMDLPAGACETSGIDGAYAAQFAEVCHAQPRKLSFLPHLHGSLRRGGDGREQDRMGSASRRRITTILQDSGVRLLQGTQAVEAHNGPARCLHPLNAAGPTGSFTQIPLETGAGRDRGGRCAPFWTRTAGGDRRLSRRRSVLHGSPYTPAAGLAHGRGVAQAVLVG